MRCRKLKDWVDESNTKHRSLVWFGSYGKNHDGTARFEGKDKHDNFSEKEKAVSDSLTQKVSLLQGELWYNVSFGLPLLSKNRNKTTYDSFIASTILSHKDVVQINSFESKIENQKYYCYVVIKTIYFYLGIPVMFGASLLKVVKYIMDGSMFTVNEILALVLGMVTAFATSMIAIKFLIGYIKKHNFIVFGWYRIALGCIVLLLNFLF